jgi:hypothetical protein
MRTKFVELHIPGFRAVVPSLTALPAKELLMLLNSDQDSIKQFTYATMLLRSKLSEELQSLYDQLDMEETMEFVTQWVAKSKPSGTDD